MPLSTCSATECQSGKSVRHPGSSMEAEPVPLVPREPVWAAGQAGAAPAEGLVRRGPACLLVLLSAFSFNAMDETEGDGVEQASVSCCVRAGALPERTLTENLAEPTGAAGHWEAEEHLKEPAGGPKTQGQDPCLLHGHPGGPLLSVTEAPALLTAHTPLFSGAL